MREKEIEDYLRLKIKTLGGRAYKFVSPGNAGVPDRLVLLPGGRIAFAEMKAPGGRATPLQKRQMEYIASLGFSVWLLDSRAKVDDFAQAMQKALL